MAGVTSYFMFKSTSYAHDSANNTPLKHLLSRIKGSSQIFSIQKCNSAKDSLQVSITSVLTCTSTFTIFTFPLEHCVAKLYIPYSSTYPYWSAEVAGEMERIVKGKGVRH